MIKSIFVTFDYSEVRSANILFMETMADWEENELCCYLTLSTE